MHEFPYKYCIQSSRKTSWRRTRQSSLVIQNIAHSYWFTVIECTLELQTNNLVASSSAVILYFEIRKLKKTFHTLTVALTCTIFTTAVYFLSWDSDNRCHCFYRSPQRQSLYNARRSLRYHRGRSLWCTGGCYAAVRGPVYKCQSARS